MNKPWVVITGAANGIGREVARELSEMYRLMLVDMDRAGLTSVALELNRSSAEHAYQVADLADASDRALLVNSMSVLDGDLWGVVHAAGAYPLRSFAELTSEDLQRAFDVHVVAVLELAVALRHRFSSIGGGRILAISSTASVQPLRDLAAYATSKGALESAIRAIAIEYGSLSVTANVVRVGSVDVGGGRGSSSDPELLSRLMERQCIPRRGKTVDVAAAVKFLLSEGASFITGQDITVDGGLMVKGFR